MAGEVQAERLAGVELFSGLPAEELEKVAQQMKLTRARVGTVVAAEGELPTTFFVVLSGNVTVHREGHHVTDLGAGDVFGEAGTVALQPRNATVIATTPAEIGAMMGWDLRDLVERSPLVKSRVEAIIAGRPSAV